MGRRHNNPSPHNFFVSTHLICMNRKLLTIIVLLLPFVAGAQVRLSIDERSVQVAEGKKMTRERSIYLNPDGRMVTEQHTPTHTISLSNTLGEMRIYTPATGEVVAMNNKGMASSKEIVAIFASGAYADMALGAYGYTQSEVRSEDGVIIKTFIPASTATVAKVELVFQNHLPICMIDYGSNGEVMRKIYFARYEFGRIPMPMRITEIEYTPKRDSLVRLSTFSNLLFDSDATSEMFEWQVPADAKRIDIDPNKLFSK